MHAPASMRFVALIIFAGLVAFTLMGCSAQSSAGTGATDSSSPNGTAVTIPAGTPTPAEVSPTPTPAPTVFGILDGGPMTASEWAIAHDRLPVAVMIDNNLDAFPQAGLDQADIVYEALVEGGSTRFMAVYWRRDAGPIEPVRSARTPFLYWASELDALYAHGGSADTFNEANAGGQLFEWEIRDLEAFADRGSAAYYRDPERTAPHDLATSTQKLRAAAAKLAADEPLYRGESSALRQWKFKADRDGTTSAPLAGGIEIDWNRDRQPLGVVQWRYEQATNSYRRFQFGGPHIDAVSKKQLSAKNVIVIVAPHEVVDDAGHVVYDLTGSGPVKVFLDGREIDGTWQKKDRTSRTLFFSSPSVEIALNRGPVWIEVVGPETQVQTAATANGLPKLPVR